jgi:hypothetical protein
LLKKIVKERNRDVIARHLSKVSLTLFVSSACLSRGQLLQKSEAA